MEELAVDVVNYLAVVLCSIEYLQLPVRAGSMFQDPLNMHDRVPASKIVYNVINKIKQLIDQYPCIHFSFLSKIDHAAVDTIPPRTPFIFVNQHARINDEV